MKTYSKKKKREKRKWRLGHLIVAVIILKYYNTKKMQKVWANSVDLY